MRLSSVDLHRLTLVVLRLMDADLLLPEEGSALLAEIAAFEATQDKSPVERASAHREPFLVSLEALANDGNLGVSAGRQAQEAVRRILHGDDGPA